MSDEFRIDFGTTGRGFRIGAFLDRYNYECSIQESSLVEEPAIWFGISDPKPQRCVPGLGWQTVELPVGTLVSTRMHLTQEMVRELLPILEHFAKTGKLADQHALEKLARIPTESD